MSTRHFTLTLTATISLDDKVIDRVLTNEDNWREHYYNLRNVAAVAEHIGYNLVQGAHLSQLDGWADMPDGLARLTDLDVEYVVEDHPPEKSP